MQRRLWEESGIIIGPSLFVLMAGLTLHHAVGQAPGQDTLPVASVCAQLNQEVIVKAGRGELAAAESALSLAVVEAGGADPVCAGLVLNNLAAIVSASGRFAEAEALATRSVAVLERILEPDSTALLRPLQILAGVQLELGKIGEARQATRKMQKIRTSRPEDRALMHGTMGALYMAESRWAEAESELRSALTNSASAEKPNSAFVVSVLNALASLYTRQARTREAAQMLDRAVTVLATVPDAVPMDRVHVLQVRAALYSSEQNWRKAAQDFEAAISIVDREPKLDAIALANMLSAYAYVLRKDHRKREAQSINGRAAALHVVHPDDVVVDASELSHNRGRTK